VERVDFTAHHGGPRLALTLIRLDGDLVDRRAALIVLVERAQNRIGLLIYERERTCANGRACAGLCYFNRCVREVREEECFGFRQIEVNLAIASRDDRGQTSVAETEALRPGLQLICDDLRVEPSSIMKKVVWSQRDTQCPPAVDPAPAAGNTGRRPAVYAWTDEWLTREQ
jgi:hypothetical protein